LTTTEEEASLELPCRADPVLLLARALPVDPVLLLGVALTVLVQLSRTWRSVREGSGLALHQQADEESKVWSLHLPVQTRTRKKKAAQFRNLRNVLLLHRKVAGARQVRSLPLLVQMRMMRTERPRVKSPRNVLLLHRKPAGTSQALLLLLVRRPTPTKTARVRNPRHVLLREADEASQVRKLLLKARRMTLTTPDPRNVLVASKVKTLPARRRTRNQPRNDLALPREADARKNELAKLRDRPYLAPSWSLYLLF
jgi:hypothetical protein